MNVLHRRLLVAAVVGVALYILFIYMADFELIVPTEVSTEIPFLGDIEQPVEVTTQPFTFLREYGLWIASGMAVTVFAILHYRKKAAEEL